MNKRGFTLLEVSLFLAVSGGLSLIAFAGLAPRLRNLRFTDAVRGLDSQVNSQIIAANSGVNNRPDTINCFKEPWGGGQPKLGTAASASGTSKDCVVNGKLAVFLEDRTIYHTLVSLRLPNNGCSVTNTFKSITQCFKPRIARNGEQPAPQTLSLQNGLRATGDTSFPFGFGYVQDPNSTTRHYFFFNSVDASNGVGDKQFVDIANSSDSGADRSVCLGLGSRRAKLTFSLSNPKPKLEFEGCS